MKHRDIVQSFMEINNGEKLVQRTGLRVLSSTDRIRQIIRHELSEHAHANESETFDEADDFDLPDNEEWVSPYEERFDPPSGNDGTGSTGNGNGGPPSSNVDSDPPPPANDGSSQKQQPPSASVE